MYATCCSAVLTQQRAGRGRQAACAADHSWHTDKSKRQDECLHETGSNSTLHGMWNTEHGYLIYTPLFMNHHIQNTLIPQEVPQAQTSKGSVNHKEIFQANGLLIEGLFTLHVTTNQNDFGL